MPPQLSFPWLRRVATLDVRSLALLRIAVASVVLLDLALRARDLRAHYCDDGIFPRAALLKIPHNTFFDIYMAVESVWGVGFLFSLTALFATAMLIGYRSRSAALGTWLMMMALKHRNPLILDAGDLELGLVLFWCIHLPIGERFSLDSCAAPPGEPEHFSPASVGYVVQLGLIYLMSAVNKYDPVWWHSGEALYYALSIDQFATEAGRWLLGHPELMRWMTYSALALEYSIPILLWLPLIQPYGRLLGAGAIVLLHLAIASMMQLGVMVPIALCCMVGLLPWPKSLGERETTRRFLGAVRRRLPQGEVSWPLGEAAWKRCAPLFLTLCIAYSAFINYAMSINPNLDVPLPIKLFGYVTQLQQDWPTFAPCPTTEDGWFIVEGFDRQGQPHDLLRGGTPDYRKPPSVADSFANQRWRRWYQNIESRQDAGVDEAFLRWAAQRRSPLRPGEPGIYYARIVYVSERTPPPGQVPTWQTRVLRELYLDGRGAK